MLVAAIALFGCEAPPETPTSERTPAGAGEDWAHYLGHPTSNHYSTLDQINTENVGRLEEAWTYETGDSDEFQSNNLIVHGMLFTVTPTGKITALDGATGAHRWTFEPPAEGNPRGGLRKRGVMYWEDGEDRRVLASYGSWLYALQAQTGQPIPDFGEGGRIHLGDDLDVEGRPAASLNTPGHVYQDLLIIGTNVSEYTVPGAIRAYDVRTGKREWIFHTLPRPGEFGSDTWPEGYMDHVGGASAWAGLAIDTERGVVYAATESAGPDFYGGRRYGENLFANSIVALDAKTGERLWHHQLVHHDLWDMDNPTPPTLLTVWHEGERVDVVAQGTKMGLLFVFNRETGEPLWPIHERPAPATEIEEIRTWPTQPFPEKPPPLMRQLYTEEDVSIISAEARQMTTEMLQRRRSFGSFPPPSLEQTIKFPGYDGGFEWGGSAADPEGILYVNINEMPWFYQLVPTQGTDGETLSLGERQYRIQCATCHGLDRAGTPAGGMPSLLDIEARKTREEVTQVVLQGGGRMPAFDQITDERRQAIIDFLFGVEETIEPGERWNDGPYEVDTSDTSPYVFRGFQRWLDDEGYPAIKPPWGTLNAVDLNTGTIKWKVPLGEYEELTARGIPVTGTENYGGPVVTAGGVIFIGATADETFRAFDKETGEILWEADLPFGGNATPSTYMAGGKQYVVISAGGAKTNRPAGGSIVAFALPD